MTTYTTVSWAIAAVAVAWAVSFVVKAVNKRRFYRNLPGPPHSWLFGHARIVGEYAAKLPADSGTTPPAFTQMKQDFNLPEVWYLDLWPFGPEFVVLSSPEAAAFATTANAMGQADIVIDFLDGIAGKGFIEASNGAQWKELHKIMMPSLTPAAVRAHQALLIDEARILHQVFEGLAEKGGVSDLADELSAYPFAVIGHIFFGERIDARQGADARLYHDFKRLAEAVGIIAREANPFSARTRNAKKDKKEVLQRVDAELLGRIRRRDAMLREDKGLASASLTTSIMDRMLLSRMQSGLPLDERLAKVILDK